MRIQPRKSASSVKRPVLAGSAKKSAAIPGEANKSTGVSAAKKPAAKPGSTKNTAAKPTTTKKTASKSKPKKSRKKKKPQTFWGKVHNGFQKTVRQGNSLGGLAMNIRTGKRQLKNHLDTGWLSAMGTAGMYVGLAAAALKVGNGLDKLYSAAKTKKLSKAIEGVKDFGSAALTGFSAASMVAARLAFLPFYAGFNTFRGLYTIALGRKQKNKQRQFLGLRRTVSSVGLLARSLKRVSPFFKTAGVALAPVAGALQAGQGVHRIVTGLKEDNNRKELLGLVDIASATGLTLALTGVATAPGLAIFGTSTAIFSAYTMSKTVRKVMDPMIDAAEPVGKKGLNALEKVGKPIEKAWQFLKDRFDGDEETVPDYDDFFSVLSVQDAWDSLTDLAGFEDVEEPDAAIVAELPEDEEELELTVL